MIIGASFLVVMAVMGEIVMRRCLGFCNAPLYSSDSDFEYMMLPNQDGIRFGKHFHINSFRQRSDEPDSSKKKVLGLGDSVMFGGTQSSNEETVSYYYDGLTGNQMLNISAGSWGPDNCVAYLNRYGLFDANAICLLVSSHDAHDNMTHETVAGVHLSYPDKQYACAWFELVDRYLSPRVKSRLNIGKKTVDPDQQVLDGIDKHYEKNGKSFNTGFDDLKRMADENGIPLYVFLHAEKKELKGGGYNYQGEEIIRWCADNGIVLIKDMDEGITEECYRDNIHLNPEGCRFVAGIMAKVIK